MKATFNSKERDLDDWKRLFAKADTRFKFISDTQPKEGQLAILLLRLYRSLDTLFGGNSTQCQLWLRSHNLHLGLKPIKLIETIQGLTLTLAYLDVMRGKN